MASHAVILDNVVRRFGKIDAVKGVSLEILPREFVAFIGPSGCGKTTTLRLIAGLERPTSGSVWIDGRRVDQANPWDRDTPMVWQNFALFPFLSVRGNVEFGLRQRRISKQEREERVDRALEMVGISELAGRQITELSGGQKQRVGIARALVINPTVLLLDEPLGALDANLRVRMQSELRTLQRKLGITFVYVTHNQSEAFAMADRIVVMNEGQIQQIGTPQEIYRQPGNRFVAEFVGVNNIFTGEIVKIEDGNVYVLVGQREFCVCDDDQGRRLGQSATFLISADRITSSYEADLRENSVEGELKGIEFIGTLVTLLLEVEGGREFRIQKQEHEARKIPTKLGERLVAPWSIRDAHLLPPEGKP